MPLPGASSKSQSPNDSGGRNDTNSKKRSSLEQLNTDLRAQIKRFKAAQNGATDQTLAGGGGGGKGGGKGKGKGRSPKIPSGLVGKNFQTTHGEPICFAYNLSNGCSQAKAGGRCSRSFHVCAEPGCSSNHSLQQHSSADQ